VQISTCVHQDNPKVLETFLEGLAWQDRTGIDVSYAFVLHNPLGYEEEMMRRILGDVYTEVLTTESGPAKRGRFTHFWGDNTVSIVASAKNRLIEKAKADGVDYIFFCDSDQVLQPQTLQRLISLNEDIVGEIMWTKWRLNEGERPNAWDFNEYEFRHGKEEVLRSPGVYDVGFIGGCLLVSQKVLQAGVNYSPIPNLTYWGEDRHFGVRAAVHGFQMKIDTTLPLYHIYRDDDLDGLGAWKNSVSL
jgi:hypothetical protein